MYCIVIYWPNQVEPVDHFHVESVEEAMAEQNRQLDRQVSVQGDTCQLMS